MNEPNEVRKKNKLIATKCIQSELQRMTSHSTQKLNKLQARRLIIMALDFMELNEFEAENYYNKMEIALIEFWNYRMQETPIPQEEVKYAFALEEASDLFFKGEYFFYITSKQVITM